jgi:hypothetical protein
VRLSNQSIDCALKIEIRCTTVMNSMVAAPVVLFFLVLTATSAFAYPKCRTYDFLHIYPRFVGLTYSTLRGCGTTDFAVLFRIILLFSPLHSNFPIQKIYLSQILSFPSYFVVLGRFIFDLTKITFRVCVFRFRTRTHK